MALESKEPAQIQTINAVRRDENDHVENQESAVFSTADLATLGLSEEVPRDIGYLDIICIGWNICISWAGVAATLALSIALGGSVSLLYGIIVIFVLVGCSGLTVAELVSVYPTAGGQYHWISILAPARVSRALSYACGITNVYSWIASTASVCILISEGLVGLTISQNPDYIPQKWHYFLIFQAFNVLSCLHNIFTLKRTLWIYDLAFVLALIGFFVIVITCLVIASLKQSSEIFWTNFVNESGWPDGVSFLSGLISANFMYAGLDGAVHLCEECKSPEKVVPKAIISTLLLGVVTSFIFTVAMVYCIFDFEAVVNTPTGFPIYEIWFQATRSSGAAIVYMLILLAAGIIALIAIQQTASRLIWSLARDNALVGSKLVSRIHSNLKVPVWALLANSVIVFIISCIFLGSSTAFNAILGTTLILQQSTYAIPAALLMYQKRSIRFLPKKRPFRLYGPTGWVVNGLTVIFGIVVLIFYSLPVVLPVNASNMNYTCAVLGVIFIFAAINWLFYGRKMYHGPRLATA